MELTKMNCAPATDEVVPVGGTGQVRKWMPALAVAITALVAVSTLEPYLAHAASSWLIFGLLGLSLSLVWGQLGFLSLGQTAFYGLGGYAASVVAINVAAGNPMLVALPVGAAVGALSAIAIGWVVFYGRMGALQGTILTYTFTLVLWTVAVSLTATAGKAQIGGDNGISEIPGFVAGLSAGSRPMTPNEMLGALVVLCALAYGGCRVLMASSFGKLVVCVRQNPDKSELLGIDIRRVQLILFALAGAIAGVAGALYCAWGGYTSPSIFSAQEAMLVPIYVLAGGVASLGGAFLGAGLVGALSFWLGGGAAGGQATLVLGICLMVLVLFAPKGIVGLAQALATRHRERAGDGAATPVAVSLDVPRFVRLVASGASGACRRFSTVSLFKRYGGVTPVKEVSRRFEPGAPHALIGPNGAGKSSYLRCCSGQVEPDAGRVQLDDLDITRWPAFRRVRSGVGIKTQAPLVYRELSVQDNLWVAAYRVCRDRAAATEAAAAMLHALGLQRLGGTLAGALPHGTQQWLDIAMVMIQRPGVLFLDEPAAGMTGQERRELAKLIALLGTSVPVVVVEHDMEFVNMLGGHVTVLHQGEVFAEGDIASLRTDDRVLDVYLGKKRHVPAH